jgi:hypothetical protein
VHNWVEWIFIDHDNQPTFARWKQVYNAIFKKEPGNPQLHRLRMIHLYESNYNSLLGKKLRQVIHHAKENGSIHEGTYGSQANHQAVDPTFLEVLQYDYASLTRWPEIMFTNDATSCNDRIVPSVSNVVIARSMGLHKKYCFHPWPYARAGSLPDQNPAWRKYWVLFSLS